MDINNQQLAHLLDHRQVIRALAGAEVPTPQIAKLTDTPYETTWRIVQRKGKLHTGMKPQRLMELALLVAEREDK